MTLGATFVLGDQRVLFQAPSPAFVRATNHQQWDVAPDDRRFVMLRRIGLSGGANADPLTVIQVDNWLTELKAGQAGGQK